MTHTTSNAPKSLHPFLLCFDEVYDPRSFHPHHSLHELRDILAICLLATLCGMSDYDEFYDWAILESAWLERLLELPHGIPSACALRRVFEAIDPDELHDALLQLNRWMSTLPERFIAVDGKACRGAHLADQDGRALMMLNAFARDNNLMLSSVALAPGQNEPGALPAFLNSLNIEGSCVTVDAGGSTRPVAEAIRQGGADYILSIKENQPETRRAIEQFFEWALAPNRPQDQHVTWAYAQDVDKAHGRIETRQVWCSEEKVGLEGWRDVRTIVMQRTTCETQGEVRVHQRYFISSKRGANREDAQELLEAIRGHWSVENNGHWVLDVIFGEDTNQVRSRRGAHNLSLVRKMAMNMLRRDTKTPKRVSMKRRMLRCLLSPDYREHILSLVALSPDSVP